MENKKAYHKHHVENKVDACKQILKNVDLNRKQYMERKRLPTKDEKSNKESIKITETYDEILDLRKAFIVNGKPHVENVSTPNRPFIDESLENNGCKKLSDLPRMQCKIMSLCAFKNSKKFSETFNTKTDIIAERIVNKQQELQSKEKAKPKSRLVSKAPLLPVRLNEKCVAQRIFNTERELKKKSEKKTAEIKKINSKSSEDQRPGILKQSHEGSVSSQVSVRSNRSIDRCRPRFQLSTKPVRPRSRISTISIQVNLERPSILSICTQTEDARNFKHQIIQTAANTLMNAKTIQTRIYKTNSVETSPFFLLCPDKYTNTISAFPSSEQSTQMYEHFTMSDLFCLDWVNKHLFTVNLNPFNIVVDDKIKDVSEIPSKSTFLSELKTIRL